jgi:hypothetical protein
MPTFDIDSLTGRIPDLEDGVRFPAVESGLSRDLCQALVDGAPGSVAAVADAIHEVDDGTDWKRRFLLHQACTFVHAPGMESGKRKLQAALLEVLREARPAYQKTFVVSQLQFIADAEVLPVLAGLLPGEGDARLVDATVAAMVAAGAEAKPFLRRAAGEVQGGAKDAVENALLQVG